MPLQVLSVRFNHDPTSATTDALNIRKNLTQPIVLPEWRRGETLRAEDSRAAYARRAPADRGRPFTIKARFRRTAEIPPAVQIRARDPRPVEPVPTGCAGVVLWLVLGALTSFFRSVNALGDVAPRDVVFAGDESDEVLFELPFASVDRVGVRVDDISWQWEYRAQGGAWLPFDNPTHHRIYCLPDTPNLPWGQGYDPATPGGNPLWPWTDVLDHACWWANLSADADTAAARVTGAVYSLGPRYITYDCPNHGRSHYTRYGLGGLGFACTEFLDRLADGPGFGRFVNCTDCSAIVITFANVLGANLRTRRMHDPQWNTSVDPLDRSLAFALNEIAAIGTDAWTRVCPDALRPGGWGNFNYHETPWVDAGTAAEAVYDACLKVDGDADPTTRPHVPLLVTRLPFAEYRDRLAAPGPTGRGRCIPQADASDVELMS